MVQVVRMVFVCRGAPGDIFGVPIPAVYDDVEQFFIVSVVRVRLICVRII